MVAKTFACHILVVELVFMILSPLVEIGLQGVLSTWWKREKRRTGYHTVTEWLTPFRFFFLVTWSLVTWSGAGSEEDRGNSGIWKDGYCWGETSSIGTETLLDVVQICRRLELRPTSTRVTRSAGCRGMSVLNWA